MSGASDDLREFGDMVDAGQGSKIREPEPSHWAEGDDILSNSLDVFARAAQAVNRGNDTGEGQA